MNILEVKDLTKKFGEFTAVNGISFSLHKGEILGVLGPNGAGKTTTIQMLLGLLTPSSGDIKYFDKSLKDFKTEILEQVNFSSSYISLPRLLTVKECLIFISYLYKIKNRKKRIQKIIDTFKLGDLLTKKINQLSAGQLTRVNLAKSFLNHPKILLLDEPTASLDPEVASYVRDFLLEERKNFNLSIIITSHNMQEVEQICSRVIFIHRGKIIADDTPESLARSNGIARIEFLFNGNITRAEAFLRSARLTYTKKGKYICIALKEKDVAAFLQSLSQHNINFSEISVEKPGLEDYFLSTAKQPLD